ncbi:hypothetical protein BH09PAT4_BH09PAT4_09210 [soil metagenome]
MQKPLRTAQNVIIRSVDQKEDVAPSKMSSVTTTSPCFQSHNAVRSLHTPQVITEVDLGRDIEQSCIPESRSGAEQVCHVN